MKKKRLTKKEREILAEWISNHGACGFDMKNEDIILYDGGLFGIEKKRIMLNKITGTKRLPSGMHEIIFSKRKYPTDDYYARLWMCELDNTISYFKSMKKMLNSLGVRTNLKKK